MTHGHFQQQMERLIGVFGKNAYPPERAAQIFKEVKDFSDFWFRTVVDDFIGRFRQAPLMLEFREEISKERERLHRIRREEERQDAADFWKGTYHTDEVKEICKTIRMRLEGKVSDSDYAKFIQTLENVAERGRS